MSSYRELTLDYIKELNEENTQLVSDLYQLETIEQNIKKLKEEINDLNDQKEKIDKKYRGLWKKYSLTDGMFILYCDHYRFNETNLKIKYIKDKTLFLSGSYNYGQHTLDVTIPDYEQFIKDGYYKFTFYNYDSTCKAIIVNRYTPEIMKEVIYMRLKEKLKSLLHDQEWQEKQIKEYTEKLQQTKKDIESYHNIHDSTIRGLYNNEIFFPTDMKDEFMDSLPRKIDVHKLLEEEKNETNIQQV